VSFRLMLPDVDGYVICETQARPRNNMIPVIMVTGRTIRGQDPRPERAPTLISRNPSPLMHLQAFRMRSLVEDLRRNGTRVRSAFICRAIPTISKSSITCSAHYSSSAA